MRRRRCTEWGGGVLLAASEEWQGGNSTPRIILGADEERRRSRKRPRDPSVNRSDDVRAEQRSTEGLPEPDDGMDDAVHIVRT
jgi:hypothetical protein